MYVYQLALAFQDENGDGYLSFDELRQALEKDSGGIDNNLADRAMKALDISGDGFIEYHEFLAAAIDRQRILTDHTLADLFGIYLFFPCFIPFMFNPVQISYHKFSYPLCAAHCF